MGAMNLKEFVTVTLTDIQEGVQDAIKYATDKRLNGVINPKFGDDTPYSDLEVERVEFDVAVTVKKNEDDKEKASLGARIYILETVVGSKRSKAKEESNITRVKFTVPIIPPVTVVDNSKSKN